MTQSMCKIRPTTTPKLKVPTYLQQAKKNIGSKRYGYLIKILPFPTLVQYPYSLGNGLQVQGGLD